MEHQNIQEYAPIAFVKKLLYPIHILKIILTLVGEIQLSLHTILPFNVNLIQLKETLYSIIIGERKIQSGI